ncbi:preprotein translocase subunit YajC [Acidisoma sp. C75]
MHLISPAYAQTLGGASSFAGIAQFLPLVLIFAVFYFMLIRPQQQKQKALKASLSTIKRGDRVVTAGGILGLVQKTREGSNEIEVEIAPNVRVTVLRETISAVINPVVANDTKAGTTPPAKAS